MSRSRTGTEARSQVYRMVSIGTADDLLSRGYDILSSIMLLVNLAVTILYTFDSFERRMGPLLLTLEAITVAFFAADYVLRVYAAPEGESGMKPSHARIRYVLSLMGLIDLFSFLPYYLPVFFPDGFTVFRMLRVARIFRLFRINAYYDSLNVITEVISSKKQQLLSSVFILLILMLASSLCMYSIENTAQPQVFSNAFSGIWWAASTLLTVGYGDIFPITPLGKTIGIVIAFLGVGMVAIPTGIISAGFVEQYQKFKREGERGKEENVRFITVRIGKNDSWCGKRIMDVGFPAGMLVTAVERDGEVQIPKGDKELLPGDVLTIGAEGLRGNHPADLRELTLGARHPWCGQAIRDLNLPRQSLIVVIRRGGTLLVPHGKTVLREKDQVFLFEQHRLQEDE